MSIRLSYGMYFWNASALKNAKLRYLIFAVVFCLNAFNLAFFSITYSSNTGHSYLVDSTVCKILDVNPFDASIKHMLVRDPKYRQCNSSKVFTFVKKGIIYLNNSNRPKLIRDCVVQPIWQNGKYFSYGNTSRKFVNFLTVKDEFFKVKCFDSEGKVVGENFHMQFVKKRKVKIHDTNIKSATDPQHTSTAHSMNVLLIMLDSTSRINSLRYLPKTRKYLSDTLGAVEMLGYNKVALNTRVNMVPLLTGEFIDSLPCLRVQTGADNCPVIWKNFSNSGYFTHFAEDWALLGIFHFNKPGFKEQPTDYYDHPFHVANERGKGRLCPHGKSSTDILHDRMFDLAFNIKKPFFSFSAHASHTHDTLHGAASIDDSTMNVLSKLYKNNLLNNTFLAVFGDHGMRFGSVRQTFVGQLEEMLPMMFIYVPQWFRSKHGILFKNLNLNARRLTTHFDMYYTLLHILKLQENDMQEVRGKGTSLFREIPLERSCYDANIDDKWCICNYDKASFDSDILKKSLARALLVEINNYLKEKNVNQKCRLLKLQKVKYSMKVVSRGQRIESYKIIILTSPGDAVFESTLVFNQISKRYQVVGDINRLTKYESQSHCVKDAKLKTMCICK